MEADLKRAEEITEERSVTVGNLKNELLTAQNQLKVLDTQMTKDREKLLKLREDKKILLDKVSVFFVDQLQPGKRDRGREGKRLGESNDSWFKGKGGSSFSNVIE